MVAQRKFDSGQCVDVVAVLSSSGVNGFGGVGFRFSHHLMVAGEMAYQKPRIPVQELGVLCVVPRLYIFGRGGATHCLCI
jgi:hypothetical protein